MLVCADKEEKEERKVAACVRVCVCARELECVRGWVRERVRAEGPRVGFLVYTGGDGRQGSLRGSGVGVRRAAVERAIICLN